MRIYLYQDIGLFLLGITAVIFLLTYQQANATSLDAPQTQSDCIIPDSGPWPPCATSEETTTDSDTTSPPIIHSVQLRYEKEDNRVIIYKDLLFSDEEGDAGKVDWELTNIIQGNPNNILIRDEWINASPTEQKSGATVTSRFACAPNDTTTLFDMKVTLFDKQGNSSNTAYFQENCGAFISSTSGNDNCVFPQSGPWPPCASNRDDSAPISQASELRYFNADKTNVTHDDILTLSWAVDDAEYVIIRPLQHYMALHTISDLPTTGSQTIDLKDICDSDGTIEFEISARMVDEQVLVLGSLTVASQSFDWFMRFENDEKPQTTPCAPAEQTHIVAQKFEHGTMIWLASKKSIYVLFNDIEATPRVWRLFDDTYVAGELESDPNIVPPAGLHQPVRGFGKVWRDNLEIRSALGWATNGEMGFTTTMQRNQYCHGIRCGYSLYLAQPDEQTLWHIQQTGSSIFPRQWLEQAFTFD